MEQKENIEYLKFTIDRYDHYFEAVNNKGNVYLTIIIFLLGGTITGFFSLTNKYTCSTWQWILFYGIVIIETSGILITLAALKPYLKGGTKKTGLSAIYFADVASCTAAEFIEIIDKRNAEHFYNDIMRQVHQLAKGLRKKYILLSWCTYIIGTIIFLLLGTGLFIFK